MVSREQLSVFSKSFYRDPDGLLQLILALSKKSTLNRISPCPTYPVAVKTPDLPERIRSFERLVAAGDSEPSALFGNLFENVLDRGYRRKSGIYFTSSELAEYTVELLDARPGETIVDPGCGTGIFASKLFQRLGPVRARQVDYVGMEIDPFLALSSAVSLDMLKAPGNWRVLYCDFLSIDREYLANERVSPVDAIIANPPFVRSRRIVNGGQLSKSMQRRTGYQLSGMAGLHSFFLAQSSAILGPEGRMLFLLPSEISTAHYASALQKQLELKFNVQKFDYWTISGDDSEPLRWLFRFMPHRTCADNSSMLASVGNEMSSSLISIARVHRGISTGCNAFFVLSDGQARELGITTEHLRKVVPTRIRFPKNVDVLTEEYWSQLKASGSACWLLVIPPEKNERALPHGLQHYLRIGKQEGVHRIPTCQSRQPWYSIRLGRVPDLIFTYISRQPRFLQNEARVHILTNLLGVHLRSAGSKAAPNFVKLLNEDLAVWLSSGTAGRVYARRLTKLEPGDLQLMLVKAQTLKAIPEGSSLSSILNRVKQKAGE